MSHYHTINTYYCTTYFFMNTNSEFNGSYLFVDSFIYLICFLKCWPSIIFVFYHFLIMEIRDIGKHFPSVEKHILHIVVLHIFSDVWKFKTMVSVFKNTQYLNKQIAYFLLSS